MLFRKKQKKGRPLFRRIINYFLGAGVAFGVILLLAFGYTQTSSFRNWLKDIVTEEVNSSTNGILSIGQLDGTIFTSFVISDISYSLENDTIFSADKIELKVSPLRIFLKTLYLRKLEIENANISLMKDENDELNISKITSPDEDAPEVIDSTVVSEPFDWKIDIAELILKNINFKLQSYSNRNSTNEYIRPNMDDFRLSNLNLSLSAIADIPDNEYQLYVSEFNVKPNLRGFNLLNLSGKLILLKDIAGVVDLNIITERSNIFMNAAVSEFTPFTDDDFDIAKSPIKMELNAENINFDDLTNFIDGTGILKGNVKTHVTAEGTLNDLNLKNLEVKLENSNLNASGYLQNILDGGEMIINMNFRNSYINQDDVTNLLPELEIPTYKEYGILQFDTLAYSGQPLNFKADMILKTDKGKISGLVNMNLKGEEIEYDYQIKTNKLNLMPVAGINTNLNLVGNLKGKGFSPENLVTSIQINAGASTIQGISFDEFNIDAGGANGIIDADINFKSVKTQGRFNTQFNFVDSSATKYNFDIALSGFNISDFAAESGINSDLNISFTGDGENFGHDNLNLFAVFQIDSSTINEIELDSVVLIADVRSSFDDRVINIISDLADLTISGKYSIPEMIDLIVDEVNLLSTSIQDKIAKIQPPKLDNTESETTEVEERVEEVAENLMNKNLNVQYLLELKSFELISLFLGNAEIEIDGEITGKLFSSADTTFLNLNTKIDQLRYWDGLELYFLYDFDLALTMMNGPSLDSFDDFSADLNISAERIFIGSELTNLNFDLDFDNNNADVKLLTVFDGSTSVNLNGSFEVNDEAVDVIFSKLHLSYKNYYLHNSDDIKFSYSNDKFSFDSFVLYDDYGKLDLTGELSFTGQEDLSLVLTKMNLKNISSDLLQLPPDKVIEGELNLNFTMTGTAEEPKLDLGFTIDSIKVQNYHLGSLESSSQYSNKLLNTNLDFIERKKLVRKSLGLEGTLPIDLSFYSEERIPANEKIDLTFFADNFDLRFATSFIPGIKNLVGVMNGKVFINGYYDDINNNGELVIDNSSFVLEATNLTYLLDAKLDFENDKIVVSRMNIRNEPNIKNGGTMVVSGQLDHEYFNIHTVNMNASGSLKIMDEKTKAVNPALYGNITIETREPIIFSSTEERSYLGMDLILKDGANVTYSPTQSAFTNENDKFSYIFISEETQDYLEKEIDSLLILSELRKQEKNLAQKIPFNFDLKIEVETEVKVVFVLSREFKQNLTAYLGGQFEYSVINEIPFARGELTLLDGSKLDFIKTFQAKGNIKFIEELDDPYINVVATYEGVYNPDTLRNSANEYDVQIRILLEGTAKEVVNQFRNAKDNIVVYKSRRNANQFELDPTKTSSDAIYFILLNKFQDDATIQDNNLVASTLNSFAGSLLGTILNQQFGNVIRDVKIQQVGPETMFSLIGKVEEFRYEIGGTSQVFQDLTRATVKIEHPLFLDNLVIRFYRTEPPYQSSTYSEMINALGLKYNFIF